MECPFPCAHFLLSFLIILGGKRPKLKFFIMAFFLLCKTWTSAHHLPSPVGEGTAV